MSGGVTVRRVATLPQRHATRCDDFRAAATARPGAWLPVPGPRSLTRRVAERRAQHVRSGTGRWAPAGAWDARVVAARGGRGFVIEARRLVHITINLEPGKGDIAAALRAALKRGLS